MNRTDRLYALAEELRRAGPAGRTAAALAARFEVSTRTVKRDVSALQQAGVPIWAAGGPGGGYVVDAAATLPPVNFTAGEAVAVAVALAAQPGLPYAAEGAGALEKVLGAMPAARRHEAEALAGRVWVRPQALPRTAATGVVERALHDQVVVLVDYVGGDGRRSRRRPVEPHLLAIQRGVWYVYAWCRRSDAARSFRVDRIERAVATTEAFAPRHPATFGVPPADARPAR